MNPNALAIVPIDKGDANERHAGPLDMEPAAFSAGLDRRKLNRKALVEWIRSALVEGIDFGSIQTRRGPSKPSLLKPGAEKICGMLGIITTFPTLSDYEQAALKGTEIKSVVIRCSLLDSRGVVVAEGVGARSLQQDQNDLNKALKMSEKSAHIDATLRMAGLSEIFTQDLEDMPSIHVQTPAEKPAQPAKKPSAPKSQPASVLALRKRMVELLTPCWDHAQEFAWKVGWILPDSETLDDLPDQYVPRTKEHMDALIKAVKAFEAGDEAKAPYGPLSDSGEPDVPVEHNEEAWRSYLMRFGKNKGKRLGELDKKYLFGLWANYKVEQTWTDDHGNERDTAPDILQQQVEFRRALDEAGLHYKFTEPHAGR